jgi:hypothetical protein
MLSALQDHPTRSGLIASGAVTIRTQAKCTSLRLCADFKQIYTALLTAEMESE